MGKMVDLPAIEIMPSSTPLNVTIIADETKASQVKAETITLNATPATVTSISLPAGTKKFTFLPGVGRLSYIPNYPTDTVEIETKTGVIFSVEDINTVAPLTIGLKSTQSSDIITLVRWY